MIKNMETERKRGNKNLQSVSFFILIFNLFPLFFLFSFCPHFFPHFLSVSILILIFCLYLSHHFLSVLIFIPIFCLCVYLESDHLSDSIYFRFFCLSPSFFFPHCLSVSFFVFFLCRSRTLMPKFRANLVVVREKLH